MRNLHGQIPHFPQLSNETSYVPEEELFVKKHSGYNDGKLGSAPEGPTYYTYADMLDTMRVLISAQEQAQFARIIEILEKETNTPEGHGYVMGNGYIEFVFDHQKKFGSVSAHASTALNSITNAT